MMTAAALFLLLAFVAPPAPSSPQTPAAAAAVVVIRPASGAERQTATGADGRFTVAWPGTDAVLIVRAGGFAESRQAVPSPGGSPIDVVLAPAGVSETVTVTATRSEQR